MTRNKLIENLLCIKILAKRNIGEHNPKMLEHVIAHNDWKEILFVVNKTIKYLKKE